MFKSIGDYFYCAPHLRFSYVLYALAKELGIKIVMYSFMNGLPSKLFFFNNFTRMDSLMEVYLEALSSKIDFNDLNHEIKK